MILLGVGLNMKESNMTTNDVHIGGHLFLSNCDNLKSLNNLKSVGGTLYLSGCTSLRELPNGLSICGNLHLDDCHSLKELPLDMKVDNWIFSNSKELKERYKDVYRFA
jgi:hypothetical protein